MVRGESGVFATGAGGRRTVSTFVGVDEHDALLRAARVVAERSGFDGVKVGRVLTEAGLGTRAFYRSFSTKEDLLYALFEADTRGLVRHLDRSVRQATDERHAVQLWVRAFLGAAHNPRSRGSQRFDSRHFAMLATSHPEELADLVDAVVESLATTIAGLGIERSRDLAYGVVQLCRSMLFDSALGDRRPSYDHAVAVALRIADAAFFPSTEGTGATHVLPATDRR